MSAENEPYKPRLRPSRANKEERCANCGDTLLIGEMIVNEQDAAPQESIQILVRCSGCEHTMYSSGSRWPSLSPEEAKARRRRSAIRSYNDQWRIKEEKSGL